jgi:hypothetical protein
VGPAAPPAPAARTSYRQAASNLPAAVLSTVDTLIAGDPLDTAHEQAARAAGWRRR